MDFQLTPQDDVDVDVDIINEDDEQIDTSPGRIAPKPKTTFPSSSSEFVDPDTKLNRKPFDVNHYKIVADLLELAASDDIAARKKFHLQQNCSYFANNIVLNSI